MSKQNVSSKNINFEFNNGFVYSNDGNFIIDYSEIKCNKSPHAKKIREFAKLIGNHTMKLTDLKPGSKELSNWALSELDKLVYEQEQNHRGEILLNENQKEYTIPRTHTFNFDIPSKKTEVVDLPRFLICYFAMPALYKRFCKYNGTTLSSLAYTKLKLRAVEDKLNTIPNVNKLFAYNYLCALEVFRDKAHDERFVLKEMGFLDIMFQNIYENLEMANAIRHEFNEELSRVSDDSELSVPSNVSIKSFTNKLSNGNFIWPRTKQRFIYDLDENFVDKLITCPKYYIKIEQLDANTDVLTFSGKVDGKNYLFHVTRETALSSTQLFRSLSLSLYVLFGAEHDGSVLLLRDDFSSNCYKSHVNKDFAYGRNGYYIVKNEVKGGHEHIFSNVHSLCNPASPTSPNASKIPNYVSHKEVDIEKAWEEFEYAFNLNYNTFQQSTQQNNSPTK